ncbi:hypothetical protein COU57_06935 [Candidatus Pacearchaeota archaeon CG10_big_fil_rev_8_21_14_0_10_32_14]|nr:MAG: hypothetical protein COU57_06935 [Candidatus Pacearchaeota archaeon CG10_big_fil_rev_8_21_14_0_10_32_14]
MTNENEGLERQVIELIATDRISIPIRSMGNKLYKARSELAQKIDLDEFKGKYKNERVYARVENEDHEKARGMKEAIEKFEAKYPKYGEILQGYIAEKRTNREVHLYFGMNEGKRLTAEDYLGVMTDLGLSAATAERLYPELIEVSRKLSKARDEERSVLIG